jgi:hypothetical protein
MDLKPFIVRIIKEIGPRPAGSEAEFKAGAVVAEEFKKRGAKISTQDVPVAPGIIAGVINLMTGVYLVSVILYFFVPVVTALLVAALLVLFILSRQIGNSAIDWLFKKATTRNIIGTYAPAGKAARTLIFSGHHDSPNMMPLFHLRTKRYLHLMENSIVAGLALLVPAGILRAILSGPVISRPFGLAWYDVIFGISFLGLLLGLYFRSQMLSKERNLGANDNLSAVSVLVGIADYLKNNPPKKTRVILVSFGAEEPLIYGSAGFAEGHPELIADALNVNMETVGAGRLAIIEKEKMYMLPYSPEVVDLIQRAGKRAGLDLPRIAITYGGTDSYAIIKGGGKSACLFGMDETELFALWHSPLDNPDNVKEANLQNALKICVEVIKEAEGK